jgi:hypothetical protein
MFWPITERNSLNLAVGAGYSFYTQNPGLSRWYVTPGSEISFDLYAGEFWINLHDRFSIQQNAYQDPTVSGVGDYSRLENTAGVTTTWDLNKVILTMNLDHVNYVSLGDSSTQPDGQYELVSLQAGYAVMPKTLVGTQIGAGYITYTGENAYYDNAFQWSAGLFLSSPISDYLSGRVSAGYTMYYPESGSGFVEDEQFSGIYADLMLTHRVNQYVTFTINGGRTVQLGFYSGTVEMYYARWNAEWKLIEGLGFSTTFTCENGTQGGSTPEKFDRFGGSIGLRKTLAKQLTSDLTYTVYWRDSDVSSGDYTINIVSLNLGYTF